MSYKIKNGKVVKHDQKRVDAFARSVRARCQQISQEEMFATVAGPRTGGVLIHTLCAHDDWCGTTNTGSANDCNCNPQITYYKEPTCN